MKKAVLFLFLFMLYYFSAFSQTARINGQDCPFAMSCFSNVCYGQTFDLQASLSSGSIDSVAWFERIIDGNTGLAYNSYSQVGGGALTISAPFSTLPVGNYYYRYWLVVYFSGETRTAYIDLNIVDPPNALLSASSSTICAGEGVSFTASGGSNYEFRVNGSVVQDSLNNSFSSNSLNNNDSVVVVVTENGCSTTSSPIVMTVHSRPDATSVTPSSTCLGEEMDWTYSGLTGTGPWVVSFWDPTHTIQYGPDYNVSNPDGSINDVPIPYGTPNVHFKIEDNYCPNF